MLMIKENRLCRGLTGKGRIGKAPMALSRRIA